MPQRLAAGGSVKASPWALLQALQVPEELIFTQVPQPGPVAWHCQVSA